MKIIGFIAIDNSVEMVLKGDSCLLNNSKPFFVPDWTHDVRFTPCAVLRMSRLGKHIAPKFAQRYYDAVATGADLAAFDLLTAARENKSSWTPALAFDYSLPVGPWHDEEPLNLPDDLIITPEEAVARASGVMTIRQGDMIYIQRTLPALPVKPGDVITDGDLLCRIK